MKILVLVALAAAVSACASATAQPALPAAADPHSPVPPLRHVSVMNGTVNYAPVQPRPWLESNTAVSPGSSE